MYRTSESFNLPQVYEVDTVINPMLDVRKLRHREANVLACTMTLWSPRQI